MKRASLACTLVTGVLAGTAVSADLLVMKDGATLETTGSWRVDGRRVVFTLPNGSLSSIRTDEVDLDRSAIATARAAELAVAPPAKAPSPSAPILRLTEDDLPTAAAEEEEGEDAAKQPAADEQPSGPLQIVSWEQLPMPNDGGVQLFGSVKNEGRTHLTASSVTAILYGEDGGMIANGDAQINKTTISPGESANFRVEFPGVPDFASVKFQAAARGFDTRAAADSGEGEADSAVAEPEYIPPVGGGPPVEEPPVEELPSDEPPPPGESEAGR